MLKLNNDNYFSLEANREYMSVSQYKDFWNCEAKALAKLSGEYEETEKECFIEGHFLHAWNEGKLEEFKDNNPDMYSSRGATKGQLKSNYKHCEKMIEVLETDPVALEVLKGQKEVIFTAELFGVPWKIMIDSYRPEKKVFADLKTIKSMDGRFWDNERKRYVSFLEFYGYTVQMAVYAEVERLANGRAEKDWFLPHMIIITKQDPPDHEAIYFDYEMIEGELMNVEAYLPTIIDIKRGKRQPRRCEQCDYCRATKKIKKIKHYMELMFQ